MVEFGERAPDFILMSDAGSEVRLSSFRGRKVVLYFYPKDGTSGCTQEAREFRDLAERFGEANVVILGVSKDGVESHQRFKEQNGLPFTLLSDPEAKVLSLYGVWKKRTLYGRSFLGTERTTFLIDENGTVTKVYRKVKPKGHAQACLLDLTGRG